MPTLSPTGAYIVRAGANKAKHTTSRLVRYKNPNVTAVRAAQRSSTIARRGKGAGSSSSRLSLRIAGARQGAARSRADRLYNKAAYKDHRTSVLARQRGKTFKSPGATKSNSRIVNRVRTNPLVGGFRGIKYGTQITRGNNVIYRAYVMPKAVGRGFQAGVARARYDRARFKAERLMKAAHTKVYKRGGKGRKGVITLRDSNGKFAGSRSV